MGDASIGNLNAIEIAAEIVAGNIAPIARLFTELGSANAILNIGPDVDDIECQQIRSYLAGYHEISRGGITMPKWSQFDLQEMKPLLGSLHVLSARSDQPGLHYEIYGTDVAVRYNRDLTRTDLPLAGYLLPVLFHGVFLASIQSKRPIYTFHQPADGSRIRGCQRLMVPYCNDNGDFHRLVVAHRPARTARGLVGGVL